MTVHGENDIFSQYFSKPVSRTEYDSAVMSATKKFLKIRGSASSDEKKNYSFDYLQLLIEEALVSCRCADLTKNEYKKRHIPKNAPTSKFIVTENTVIVKGEIF